MSFFSNFFQRIAGTDTRSAKLYNLEAEQVGVLGIHSLDTSTEKNLKIWPQYTRDQYFSRLYHSSAELQSVLNKKADTIAAVKLRVMRRKLTGTSAPVEVGKGNPIHDLLNNPNPYMTKTQLIRTLCTHKDVYGKFFLALEQHVVDGELKYYLVPLDPKYVIIVPDPDTKYYAFLYKVGAAEHYYPANRVVYGQDINLGSDIMVGNFWYGQSKMTTLLNDIEAADYSKRNYKSTFKRGRPPKNVIYQVNVQRDISEAELRALKEDYKNRTPEHLGAIITPSFLTPHNIPAGADDMTAEVVSKLTRQNICDVYGVPAAIFNPAGGQLELEQLEYLWWSTCLLAETNYLAECINKLIEPLFNGKFYVEFDKKTITALTIKALDNAKVRVADIASGAKTINEVREDLDLPVYSGESAELGDTPMPKWNMDMQMKATAAASMGTSPSLPMPGSEGSRDQSVHGEAEMIDQTGKRSIDLELLLKLLNK